MRTALYRHFDADGALLYVGISLNSIQRTSQHSHGAHWFQRISRIVIEWHESRELAEAAERKAIGCELPAFNIVHAGRRHVDSEHPITNPPWATNEVRCRGDALGPEVWRGTQWSVTTHGVEARDGSYFICRSRMFEGVNHNHPWEAHMAEKGWVDEADFAAAIRIGRLLFPRGTRRAYIPQEAEA